MPMFGATGASLAATAQSSSGPIDALLLNTHLFAEMPGCMSNRNGALAIISDSATSCNAGAGTAITAGGNVNNKCLARCDGASGKWVLASGGGQACHATPAVVQDGVGNSSSHAANLSYNALNPVAPGHAIVVAVGVTDPRPTRRLSQESPAPT